MSNLTDLIPFLRLKIGDTTSGSYRYTDTWLETALVASVESLIKWMNFKYLIDGSDNIYRNPTITDWLFDEATYGIIEPQDKQIIVLMAAIIILEGSLENSAWSIASWRDAEISYSNLEQARTRSSILDRLWTELNYVIKPPMKRLAYPVKGTLPGYLNNEYEIGNMK